MMKGEEATAAMESLMYDINKNSYLASLYSDFQSGGGGYDHHSSAGGLCSMFDDIGGGGELGFLEMLGVQQEFQIPGTASYMFDEMTHRTHGVRNGFGDGFGVQDKVVNKDLGGDGYVPGTPNSSSISSASNNEGVVVEPEQEKEEDGDEDDDGEDQGSGKSKKQLKAKKGSLKKQRQPRFAFMTKSEVDHLEDGYRWRKYGQKAVKNSPFPRSYYRCTSASCGVKKRVERSCTDPSIVVTTYEGQHTHPSPLTPRGFSSAMFPDSSSALASIPTLSQMHNLHSRYQQQQPPSAYLNTPFNYNSCLFPTSSLLTTSRPAPPNFTTGFTAGSPNSVHVNNPNQSFLRDHGLLQDLIPSLVPKEE